MSKNVENTRNELMSEIIMKFYLQKTTLIGHACGSA